MTKKSRRNIVRCLSESSLDGLNATIGGTTSAMLRTCALRSNEGHNRTKRKHFDTINSIIDIFIRICLVIIFIKLESKTAFKRVIHSEELWLYRYPQTKDYVPALYLLFSVVLCPLVVTFLNFLLTRDRYDFVQSTHAWTLSLGLTGIVTSLLKIAVGRPRPDYFYRCYPDGNMVGNITADGIYNDNCTGIEGVINEGRKSFPSGHASFAFSSFGFIFCYLAAKLNVFNEKGRGQSWRICTITLPLIIATMVSISRTCDYHHHWEDVFIGSIIGFFINYLCYRQYYPTIFCQNCSRPYLKRNLHYDFYMKIGSSNIDNLIDDNESILDSGASEEHTDAGKENNWN